tara:strand:+ start:624 stop:1922 length:1299 start_codon:yes stop_codon:yes gene_type:complete
MKIKIPNKTFYQRHSREVLRFINNEDSLHIINIKSKDKIYGDTSEKIYLDFDNKEIDLNTSKKYDVIVLTDIVEVHTDIFFLLSKLSQILNPTGKLIITSFNSKYKIIIKFLELLRLKDANIKYSYIQNKKIRNITSGLGYDYLSSYTKQILPFKLLGLGTFVNGLLEATLSFLNIGIKTYSVFRVQNSDIKKHTKAIIIPAKNEEGNLQNIINRIPKNEKYEIIIPCAVSKDNTVSVAKNISEQEKYFTIKTFTQTGKGKANAVWEAMEKIDSEVVAILDADISVDPETIPDFFEIIDKNNADFVNGTRLIYEMERGSMRYLNHLGNRVFQYFVGKIISQPLTDSLCGTKVFKRDLYKKIIWWQDSSNALDPFGDFDLIFTAAFTGQKIIEYPIHYRTRTYGKTQISRFRDGYKLIKYLFKSFKVFKTSKS